MPGRGCRFFNCQPLETCSLFVFAPLRLCVIEFPGSLDDGPIAGLPIRPGPGAADRGLSPGTRCRTAKCGVCVLPPRSPDSGILGRWRILYDFERCFTAF